MEMDELGGNSRGAADQGTIRVACWAAMLVLAGAFVQPASAQPRTRPLDAKLDSLIPARPADYLTDVAGVVRDPNLVNARLRSIHDVDRLSLVAVTLPSIHDRAIEDVAREIGRKWKVATADDTIGAAVRNTGGVILVVTDIHKCRIEVATGSEGYMTDARAGDACRAAAPKFKAGDFGGGIVSIANAFDAFHRGVVPSGQAATHAGSGGALPGVWIAGMLFMGFVFLVMVVIALRAIRSGSSQGAPGSPGYMPGGWSSTDSSSSSSIDTGSSAGGGSDSFDGGGGGSDY
jgi:uncharacterized protein